jgi:uncharacterized membrane protein (TIGR02234 family)
MRQRSPGFVVVAVATVALAVCVTNFAFGEAGAGVVAAIVGLSAFGAGLSWLAMDGRQIRDAERGWHTDQR